MAQRLDLNEATIRTRLRKLEASGIMRVVPRVDLKASGYPLTALIGLKIKGRTIDDVSAELEKIPEIISILVVIGRNDLEVQVIARSLEMLNDLVNKIATIEGVTSLEKAIALNVVKYVQPWGSFE